MVQKNPVAPQPNILEVIDGAPFPLSKVELVEYAQEQDASEDVLDILQAMPDVIYKSVHEVGRRTSEMEELPNRGDMWGSEPAHELLEDPAEKLPDGTDQIIR